MSEVFADLLNRLFDTVHPPGRGPHTSAELVAWLTDRGVPISAPYVSQLRTGARNRPSKTMVDAIAMFFRVSPEYFADEGARREIDDELVLRSAMRVECVQQIASRVVGLSPDSLDELAARVEELRRAEHLDTTA